MSKRAPPKPQNKTNNPEPTQRPPQPSNQHHNPKKANPQPPTRKAGEEHAQGDSEGEQTRYPATPPQRRDIQVPTNLRKIQLYNCK